MTTLAWIVLTGLAMTALTMVGGVTLLLPKRVLDRLVLPLVAMAAADLIPHLTSGSQCGEPQERWALMRDKIEHSLAFGIGLLLLLVTASLG